MQDEHSTVFILVKKGVEKQVSEQEVAAAGHDCQIGQSSTRTHVILLWRPAACLCRMRLMISGQKLDKSPE